MKTTILALLMAGLCSSLSAQNHSELSQLGCATVTSPEEIQRVYDFRQLPAQVFKTTATVDTIPLSIHIVGRNDSSGYYSLETLFKVICQLNTHYAPVDMYFYIKWPVRYINNTSYYEHNNSSGYLMMQQNNVPNTVNVYFVQDPAGACGYFSPGADGVAIGKNCAAANSTTLVHELGHYFGLPHTFFGWENGNTPSVPNQERVVRTGARANCNSTGDGFCGTPADYLADRWNCPYTGTKTDVDGNPYQPDASLYMSYSTDACMNRFSNDQISFMQSQLHSRSNRNNLLNNHTQAPYSVMAQPTIVYPTEELYANYQKIIWNKVPGAEYYHVKVYRNKLQIDAFMQQEALVSDTTLDLDFNISANTAFNVKVTPLKGTNVCVTPANSNTQNFTSTDAITKLSVGNTAATEGSLKIVPNPVTNGMAGIQLRALPSGTYQLHLINMNGQKVLNHTFDHHAGNDNHIQVSVQNLPAGMYFLNITGEGNRWMEKLMIQH